MTYRILKQFIPTGQPGDPSFASRNVFVWRITSGSYSGSDEIFDDHEGGYNSIDQLERDDSENYQGWGIYNGDPRLYGLMPEVSGTYLPPTDEEIRDGKLLAYYRKQNPNILDFTPKTASEGETIYITGSDFVGTSRVIFGATRTKIFDIVDNNNIEVIVPTGSETGYLTVYNYNTEFDKADGWIQISGTIIQTPQITGASNDTGSYYSPIHMYGNNLQYTKRITIGGVTVPRNTWILHNDNYIEFYVPGNAITGAFRIYDFDNNYWEGPRDFHIEPSSSINIQVLYPEYGPPGDIVHIFGSYFLGVVSASIGTDLAEFEIVNDNHIRLTVPENSQPHRVFVQVSSSEIARSPEDFIWMPGVSSRKPVLDDFNPKTGSVGDIISVTGSQFLGIIGGYVNTGSVSFNMRQVTIPDRYHFTFRIPTDATTGFFFVRNNIGYKRSNNQLQVV